MLNSGGYLHTSAGRLRIKISGMKRSPETAAKIQKQLKLMTGIRQASANPLTGNLLVLFDPRKITHEKIINHLTRLGYIHGSPRARQSAADPHRALAELMLKFAMQALVEKLVLAVV